MLKVYSFIITYLFKRIKYNLFPHHMTTPLSVGQPDYEVKIPSGISKKIIVSSSRILTTLLRWIHIYILWERHIGPADVCESPHIFTNFIHGHTITLAGKYSSIDSKLKLIINLPMNLSFLHSI